MTKIEKYCLKYNKTIILIQIYNVSQRQNNVTIIRTLMS
jgi:hypothetical protein